ncbi:MAG: beta-ketoacyl-ACP synthase II [Planctomycetes bacterium]|nr:beta-ketoacyl-ACP synthase II [Planctomycetota bacterium]
MNHRRVVITGIGAVTPFGVGVGPLWSNLVGGNSAVSRITRFDPSNSPVTIAAEVRDFDVGQYLDRKAARRLDIYCQYGMVSAKEAIEQSGLGSADVDKSRVGSITGTGIGGFETIIAEEAVLQAKGPSRVSPFTVPKLMANALSAQISLDYGFGGPCFSTVSACSSANHAIGMALALIRAGACDACVTGGSEAPITPLAVASFASMKALCADRNDSPEEASRPFDLNRSGFVMSEGAAILIIETLEHARNRGAKILAELLGFGQTADAHHITAPDPEGRGGARATIIALADAGVNPEDVDYVNAHGTSTPLNDKTETAIVKRVFKDHARKLAISSTKSMLGHSLGAAGAIEAIACVKTIETGIVHPTRNLDTPDPECDLDYVPNKAREQEVNVAISNSLGFGGHNAVLVLGKIRK